MPRARVSRRRVVLLVLLFGILLEGVIAVAVMAQGNEKPTLDTALPLHPVAGNFKPDGTKLADCTSQSCTEQAFGNIAYRQGPKVALTRFDAKYGDFSDPNCHRVAHRIGSAALARNDGDVAKTFAQGSSSCFSGYYHGVLERSLLSVKSFDAETLGGVVRGLCGEVQRESMWLAYQCLHGLGHGLMITTGYDLPLSLRVCDRLHTGWETTSCNGGAFMENISTFYGVKSRWLRDDDAVYPCNWVREEDKIKCYEIVTSRILRVEHGDWVKTAEICAGVERNWVAACFRSYGRDVAGQAHEDPAKIVELCGNARDVGGEKTCIDGAARAMTGNFKSGKQASVLCNMAARDYRERCYFGIGSVMSLYLATPARRQAVCGVLTNNPTYARQCVRGANEYRAWAMDQ